jgi:hypothetical protein
MTDETNDQQEKKIIIDQDWKSQVQAEKEAARQQKEQSAEDDVPPSQESAAQESAPQDPPPAQEGPLPPPSLSYLATSLATQAMMSLGMAPHPGMEKQPEAHPQEAKHLIDMIAMLQEKTKGNQTPEESAMFDGFLHELRMAFVAVSQQSKA